MIPLVIYQQLISMQLLMVDYSIKQLVGILYDVLVKVENFIFLEYFIILNCEVDFNVTIILDRTFLTTKRILVDMERKKLKFRLNDE